MARPSLIRDKGGKIIDLLRKGNYYDTAYRAVGLSHTTFYRWMAYGEFSEDECEIDDKEVRRYPDGVIYDAAYGEFNAAVKKAVAEWEAELYSKVESAGGLVNLKTGQMDWTPWAWLLERRFPNKYGRRMIESSPDDQIQKLTGMSDDDDDITPDQLEKIADAIKAQAAQRRKMLGDGQEKK